MFDTHACVVAATGSDEDRAAVIRLSDEHAVLVLADGAGGTEGGAAAAQHVVERVQRRAMSMRTGTAGEDTSQDAEATAAVWARALADIDRELQDTGGESTAVIVEVRHGTVCGASVGDSGAWLVSDDQRVDLTCGQRRKPLLGSGAAWPVAFTSSGGASLLVASDGLLKYAPPDAIIAALREPSLEAAARRLVGLVRLKSGALPDDVAFIVGRWRYHAIS